MRALRFIAVLLILVFTLLGAHAQVTSYYWFASAGSSTWVASGQAGVQNPGTADEAVQQVLVTRDPRLKGCPWAIDYNDAANGNVPPTNRRNAPGHYTTTYFPVLVSKCNSAPYDAFLFWSPAQTAYGISEMVCDSGYEATMLSGNTVTCQPSSSGATAPVAGAGEQATQSIPSDFNCGCAATAGPTVGDPINLGTGNVYLEERDYDGAGGNRLQFHRFYNSVGAAGTTDMGRHWTHTYSRQVIGKLGVTVYLVRDDGRSIPFVFNGSNYEPPAYEHGALTALTASGALTGWSYYSAAGDHEVYSAGGYLVSYSPQTGGTMTVTYSSPPFISSVSDGLGRSLVFSYDSSSRLTQVKGPTGAIAVALAYGSYNAPVSATYADGSLRQYGYLNLLQSTDAELSLLVQLVDEGGNLAELFTYDSQGRGITNAKANGVDAVSVTYGSPVTVKNALGAVETYSLATGVEAAQATAVSLACTDCGAGAGTRSATYDGAGDMTSYVDKTGALTCLTYYTTGQLQTRVEGLVSGADECGGGLPSYARMTSWQWSGGVPSAIAAPLLITTFSLNGNGWPTAVTEQPTSDGTGAAGFSASGSGTAHVLSFTYDGLGFVTGARSARTDVTSLTSYSHDSAENLVSVTDATGLATTFGSYDANGRPGTITEPTGLQTGVTYDVRGRVTQINRGGALTTYAYSPAGLLASVTLPSGVSVSFAYDAANRLIRSSDSLGNQRALTLDLAGNITQEAVTGNGGALAFSRAMAYDQLSRLTTLTKAQ